MTEYPYSVRFINRRCKTEIVEASSERQAIAIGKSWSVRETFKLYKGGELLEVYVDGKPLSQQF